MTVLIMMKDVKGMKEITLEDCKELQEKFKNFTKNAEQHTFPMLLMLDMMLSTTISQYEETGIDQASARSMFRSVLQVIGEDYSMYIDDYDRDDGGR